MSKEKYGITDAHYICDSAIFNTETDEILRLYQICDLLNEQDQKIKELEVKLAERTKQLKIALKDFNDIQEENDKLAQQLAEKDKKIEDVEDVSRRLIRICGTTNCYGKNQKAIEKLEQVKKLLVEKMKLASDKLDCAYYIDNQIKELRGEENE